MFMETPLRRGFFFGASIRVRDPAFPESCAVLRRRNMDDID